MHSRMALAARQRAWPAYNAACDNIPDDGHAVNKEHALLGRHIAEVDGVRGRPQRI